MPRWHWPLAALTVSTALLIHAATTGPVPPTAWVIHGVAIAVTTARYYLTLRR